MRNAGASSSGPHLPLGAHWSWLWHGRTEAFEEPVFPVDSGGRRPLPPEIAFLAGTLQPEILESAARTALEVGTTAEIVLLNEGLLASETYYRRLAAFLGLPFAERPLRPAPAADIATALRTGVVALAPNGDGRRMLAAPRGAPLREFMRLVAAGPALTGAPIAVTSPERFEALLRYDRRRAVARSASHGLSEWNARLSARGGVTPGQMLAVSALAVLFCTAAWIVPESCGLAVALVFTIGFLLAVLLRLAATLASRPVPAPTRKLCARDLACDLPVYTVIVPLFREHKVVRRLVAALDRLDYPSAKLDIILVVEPNDVATLDTIEALRLPARYRAIMAPAGRPRTKPRALNVALQFARGDVIVVYDAEDEPQPDQLRKAVAAFAADPDLACLQARLAIDNIGDSWLAALFAVEYAALFHVVNPGLAALRLPIPLGGTSNHFRRDALRRVNGWDAWNVTEDIDLGIRLARFGCRVGSLDSDTFEEAPHTLRAWLRQRGRWMKGWTVTLALLSRTPVRLVRELGFASAAAVAAMLFGTIASCLLGPFCAAFLLVRAATGNLFWARSAFETGWNGASLILLAAGALSAAWPALAGLRRRGLLRLAPWLVLYPVYLLLLSLASWQALFEVFGRPHAWAKTEHGTAKHRLGSMLTG